jgi:hypothetical protein
VPFVAAELGRDADPSMLHLYTTLAKGAMTDLGQDSPGRKEG